MGWASKRWVRGGDAEHGGLWYNYEDGGHMKEVGGWQSSVGVEGGRWTVWKTGGRRSPGGGGPRSIDGSGRQEVVRI